MNSSRSNASDRRRTEFCPVSTEGNESMTRANAECVPQVVHHTWTAGDLRKAVKEAFDCLGAANPLNQLIELDKAIVWGALMTFTSDRNRPSAPLMRQLDRLAKIAKDAAKLSSTIEEVFQNDFGEVLNRRIAACEDLPIRLSFFSGQVEEFLLPLGDTGLRRKRTLEDRYLIYASEFVKFKTGTWNDEHVAELLQTMRSGVTEFSGDAIRKTRERFKLKHPIVYERAVEDISAGRGFILGSRGNPGTRHHAGRSVSQPKTSGQQTARLKVISLKTM